MSKGHVEEIERKITDLKDVFDQFEGAKHDLDRMIKIIHGKGWTTLQDVAFVEAILDAEKQHAVTTLKLNARLVRTAGTIKLNPQPLPP